MMSVTERRITEPEDLRVKIFADGADRAGIAELASKPWMRGLHDQSDADAQGGRRGLRDVRAGGRSKLVPDRPISFEVFSDDAAEMERAGAARSPPGERTST